MWVLGTLPGALLGTTPGSLSGTLPGTLPGTLDDDLRNLLSAVKVLFFGTHNLEFFEIFIGCCGQPHNPVNLL